MRSFSMPNPDRAEKRLSEAERPEWPRISGS